MSMSWLWKACFNDFVSVFVLGSETFGNQALVKHDPIPNLLQRIWTDTERLLGWLHMNFLVQVNGMAIYYLQPTQADGICLRSL